MLNYSWKAGPNRWGRPEFNATFSMSFWNGLSRPRSAVRLGVGASNQPAWAAELALCAALAEPACSNRKIIIENNKNFAGVTSRLANPHVSRRVTVQVGPESESNTPVNMVGPCPPSRARPRSRRDSDAISQCPGLGTVLLAPVARCPPPSESDSLAPEPGGPHCQATAGRRPRQASRRAGATLQRTPTLRPRRQTLRLVYPRSPVRAFSLN